MKNKWIAALALAGLLLTTGAYAESTPSETVAPVQAEAAAEPQHQLKVTTKYRYFISQYHYIRERKVSYFDNVYAYNHGEYGLTPFASTVPEEYFVADENGTLAIAPIVLDITDAMRERLYGADVGETALYYGQYCQREKDRKGVWGYTGIHEGIDFVNVKGAPLYAILGGEVTRGTDKNGTVAIYNAEYDITLLYLHCENSIVRRGDTVEAGAMIAKEGKKNIKGGDKTHYTHVELRKGRHTSSSPYRDIVLTSDCPYAVMQQALGGLARLMGYSERCVLLSAHGLVSVGALLLARTLKAARENQSDVLRFGALTLAMSAAITALSFVLLEGLYLNRYWIPLMTLGAPVMAACLTGETNAPLRRGCALLFAGVVLTASAMQITSTMKHPEITDVQRERAAFLQESGLTFGYATFWNANVITELTNGEVEAVGISIAQNEKGQGVPRVSEWLEAQENRRMERPDERVFMLLTEAESERLDDFLKKSGAQARCTRDGMTAYEIESQRIFFETAQAMDTP